LCSIGKFADNFFFSMSAPIVFDLGNSLVKVHDTLDASCCKMKLEDFITFIEERPKRIFIGLASGDVSDLERFGKQVELIQHNSLKALDTAYSSMDTLGMDRWALCTDQFLQGNTSFLLVSLGTCVTYNVVINGTFLGGAISPGWLLRYEAMNSQTTSLPIASYDPHTNLLGDNTIACLHSGVDIGIQKEIHGMIAGYKEEFGIDRVFICGGDAQRLSNPLKNYIFAPVNYELHAIHRLYRYYVDQA